MDTTDLPLHGKQEGRFFHGYYDNYCYLPLYIFCGEQVLCARLREANHDAAFGSLQEIRRIVEQIRAAWPEVKIILRGDSGFCRNELMSWCENNGVDFVFGLARNQRLRKIIGAQMHDSHRAVEPDRQTGAGVQRVPLQDQEEAKKGGWDRERRVVAKAEHIDGKENPRFVVTSLTSEEWTAQALYEELYCARGDMENRIKEQFSLFADRVSAETMRANQMRLYLSTMAYVLVSGLRRLGLKATELAEAQVSTIRTKLLKNRRADPGDRAQSLGFDGVQLSLAGSLSAGLDEPALLKPNSSTSSHTSRSSPRQRQCGAVLAIDFGTDEKISPTVLCPLSSRLSSAIPFQRGGLIMAPGKPSLVWPFRVTTEGV